ncbi:unnamed protein product [Diplocarpon coronariae]
MDVYINFGALQASATSCRAGNPIDARAKVRSRNRWTGLLGLDSSEGSSATPPLPPLPAGRMSHTYEHRIPRRGGFQPARACSPEGTVLSSCTAISAWEYKWGFLAPTAHAPRGEEERTVGGGEALRTWATAFSAAGPGEAGRTDASSQGRSPRPRPKKKQSCRQRISNPGQAASML